MKCFLCVLLILPTYIYTINSIYIITFGEGCLSLSPFLPCFSMYVYCWLRSILCQFVVVSERKDIGLILAVCKFLGRPRCFLRCARFFIWFTARGLSTCVCMTGSKANMWRFFHTHKKIVPSIDQISRDDDGTTNRSVGTMCPHHFVVVTILRSNILPRR